jgi:hypothetical protein
VHEALQAGSMIEPKSDLGRQFQALAQAILEQKPVAKQAQKRRFVDYFTMLPGRYTILDSKKNAI